MHLRAHGGLSRLKIGFSTLKAVGNFIIGSSGSGIDTWSRLNRWSLGLFIVETLKNKICNGSEVGIVRRLLMVDVGSGRQGTQITLCFTKMLSEVGVGPFDGGLTIPETKIRLKKWAF